MAEDLYQVLGVDRQASKDDIQKAYRKLARKYHPDMNPDDDRAKERFKRVQEAYDVLSDADKRAAYDRYGADFEKIRERGWHPGAGGGGSFEGIDLEQIFGGRGGGHGFEGGFTDFFEQLMGARGRGGPSAGAQRRSPVPTKGASIQHEHSIPLRLAMNGGSTDLAKSLGGKTQTISVKVPPGVQDGTKIRLRGKGHPSPTGGEAGDLILTLHVLSHPNFKQSGANLIVTLPVTIAEAVLGGAVDVPTPTGEIALKIPPGSSSGKRFRVRGHGAVQGDGSRGDLLVDLSIVVPSSVDEEQAKVLRELDAKYTTPVREGLAF